MRKKDQLPSKTCPVCGRPFVWRKKWARDWAQVIYCSQRCRQAPASSQATCPASAPPPNNRERT